MTFSVQPTEVCKAFQFWQGCIFQWKATFSKIFKPAPLGTGVTGLQQPCLCKTANLQAGSWMRVWGIQGFRVPRVPHGYEDWDPVAWVTSGYPYLLSPVQLGGWTGSSNCAGDCTGENPSVCGHGYMFNSAMSFSTIQVEKWRKEGLSRDYSNAQFRMGIFSKPRMWR